MKIVWIIIIHVYLLWLFFFTRGEEIFYPTADTLGVTEHKDSEESVSRLVDDLDKQWVQNFYTYLRCMLETVINEGSVMMRLLENTPFET